MICFRFARRCAAVLGGGLVFSMTVMAAAPAAPATESAPVFADFTTPDGAMTVFAKGDYVEPYAAIEREAGDHPGLRRARHGADHVRCRGSCGNGRRGSAGARSTARGAPETVTPAAVGRLAPPSRVTAVAAAVAAAPAVTRGPRLTGRIRGTAGSRACRPARS